MSSYSRSDTNDGHVHFDSKPGHDALIDVIEVNNQDIEVNLGFLRQHHIYEICFKLPDHLSMNVNMDALDNIHTKVKSVKPSATGQGHDIIIVLDAFKERLMKQTVILQETDNHKNFVNVTFNARVLGKGKGTPSIRTGIRCIGTDPDYDSETSDWPGYSRSENTSSDQ